MRRSPGPPTHYVITWGKPDEEDRELAPGEFRRDGRILSTPRYGVERRDNAVDDDIVEGQLSPPAAMLGRQVEAAEVEAPPGAVIGPATPTPAHIELLRLRPDKADAFDAKFGVGAAAKILGR